MGVSACMPRRGPNRRPRERQCRSEAGREGLAGKAFVAIYRTSTFAFTELHEKATRRVEAVFLLQKQNDSPSIRSTKR